MMALTKRTLLLSISILGALASVGCAAEKQAAPDGRAADELSLWKDPNGDPTVPPRPVGSEVEVGLPGLVCSSFSDLAFSAETLCRRQGLALIALRPDGFCGERIPAGDPGYPVDPTPHPGERDEKPIEPVPPPPGPGPVPGPVPHYWGFDHAVGICGYGPVPPPPPPCNEKECPPPPPPCNEKECPPCGPGGCPEPPLPCQGGANCPPPPCDPRDPREGGMGCPPVSDPLPLPKG